MKLKSKETHGSSSPVQMLQKLRVTPAPHANLKSFAHRREKILQMQEIGFKGAIFLLDRYLNEIIPFFADIRLYRYFNNELENARTAINKMPNLSKLTSHSLRLFQAEMEALWVEITEEVIPIYPRLEESFFHFLETLDNTINHPFLKLKEKKAISIRPNPITPDPIAEPKEDDRPVSRFGML